MTTTKQLDVVICRTCVGECEEYKSIHKTGLLMGEVTTLASLLSFCTNLEFLEDENSNLPTFMCTKCINELAKSCVFKRKVLQANEILSSQLDDEGYSDGKTQAKEKVIALNKSATDLQNLAKAAQMKRVQLEQQFEESSEEYLHLTELDKDVEDENQQQSEEHHELQDDIEMEYVVHEVAETTEIYHTTIITPEEMQHFEDEEEIELDQDCHLDEVEEEDNVEYEVQENDIEDYSELITDSQDGMSQHSLKRHIDDATNSGSENYSGYQRRKRRRNSRSKPVNPDFQCKVCGRQLSNASSFKYHMKLHSDETPYTCAECGDAFKTRNAYEGHITIHNPNNPNTCEICGKSYRQHSSLRMHMLTHSNVKPFTCDVCGKSLTQKSGYKKHMLTHTGEKPYPCDICGKAFRISSNMIVHRRCHTDERLHQCTECDKSFITSNQLKRHLVKHTDEKHFICEICGKQFKRHSTWRSHLKMHKENKSEKSFEVIYSEEYEGNDREKSMEPEI